MPGIEFPPIEQNLTTRRYVQGKLVRVKLRELSWTRTVDQNSDFSLEF